MSVTTTKTSGRIGNVAYEDVLAETRRRQQATATGGASTLDTNTEYSRAFQTEDQKVFLWNNANVEGHPRSLLPAFRLLGLFSTVDEALEHGRDIAAADPTCAIRLSATHAWYGIATGIVGDITPHMEKTNRNLLLHQKVLQSNADEFSKRKKHLTKGRTPVQDAEAAAASVMRGHDGPITPADAQKAVADMADEAEVAQKRIKRNEERTRRVEAGLSPDPEQVGAEETKGEDDEYEEEPLTLPPPPEALEEDWETRVKAAWPQGSMPRKVRRDLEVRNQRFASVSVLHDYEGSGAEPSVIVWAAFDTEAEALLYNRVVAAREVRDHDVGVVAMYEWAYPHLMRSDRVEQLYRNQELDAIMKHARTSRTVVANFEKECADSNMETPCITVERDLSEPAPRVYSFHALEDDSLQPDASVPDVEIAPDVAPESEVE